MAILSSRTEASFLPVQKAEADNESQGTFAKSHEVVVNANLDSGSNEQEMFRQPEAFPPRYIDQGVAWQACHDRNSLD